MIIKSSLISEQNTRRNRTALAEPTFNAYMKSNLKMPPASRESEPLSQTDRIPATSDTKIQKIGLSVKVPRSFWQDIFGQDGSVFLTQYKKNDLEPLPKAQQSHVDQVIKGVNSAVHKLRGLKQFKKVNRIKTRVDNKSEESVDEQNMNSDDSTEQAFKKVAVFNQVSMGKSLMRSTQATFQLQVKSENEIERLQRTIESLTKQYNELHIIIGHREVDLKAMQMDLDKIQSGGLSDYQQTKKLQDDSTNLITNIEVEKQRLAETLQENQVLRNMYLERKQDMISLTTPFLNDEKRLRIVKDVVQHESQQLAGQSKQLDSLRIRIQQQESTQLQVKKVLEKHVKQRSEMVKIEKMVKETFQECLNQQKQQIGEKEMRETKMKQDFFQEDEERLKVLQEIQNKKQELEQHFQDLNTVVMEQQHNNGFREYFLKLQDDKTLMFEKITKFEHLIEDTKDETKHIHDQFEEVKIKKLEIDELNECEQLLEDKDILNKLQKQLYKENEEVNKLEYELDHMEGLFAQLSKGLYCMIAQHHKTFKDGKLASQNLNKISNVTGLANNYLRIIDSLQRVNEDNMFDFQNQ